MAKPTPFMRWLRKHYDRYLATQETDGGFCAEWVTKVLDDATANPEESGWDRAGLELLARTARGLWHDDPPPPQLDLFTVAGVELASTFTFPDPTVAGGFRRVQRRWATARHVQSDAFVKRDKADEVTEVAVQAMNVSARVMAVVKNDPDALLWDYRDELGKAA